MTAFTTIEEGIEEIRQGRILIVVDDEDRENEGDLVMAADRVTSGSDELHGEAWPGPDLRSHARQRLDELEISMMVTETPPLWAPRSLSPLTRCVA